MTTLINLWGGPGCGKSTTAAEVFSVLKKNGHSAELVTEYVKAWAWRDRKIGPFDDVYITAKQLQREAACYGKVDFLVTDSPIGLGALYEQLYKPGELMMSALCVELRRRQVAAGINVLDFLLARAKPYVQAGRWEDEAAARRVDDLAADMLAMLDGYHKVTGASGVLAVLRTRNLLP